MTVIIASLENAQHNERLEDCFPDYSSELKEFSLNRPIGDDWGQYIRYIPNPSPVLVIVEARVMFVVFEAESDAVEFKRWLEDAAKEQQHGFNTMRG